MTLTPAGQVLLSHAETVIGELRTAELAVRAELDSEPARLTVGSFASAGQFLIPQALARFRQHHPDVALALQDWISGADGMPNRVCLELAARSAAFQPRIAYETRDYQLTLALIGAGLGISLVPASVLGRARHSGLTVRRLSGTDLARDIYRLHRRRPTTLVTGMITVITQLQRGLPPLSPRPGRAA